jgi:ribosome-binding ATPase YchF (GTP1/OBG family)
MSLSVGIVGLPNAGKSTLFNALVSRRLAETAPRPFTTIEPHEAVVPVPDKWLDKLYELISRRFSTSEESVRPPSEVSKLSEVVPATVSFIDIAGLVKGAHEGEGLGNQFLAKIREVDAIVHVVRAFVDPGISHQHPEHEPGTIKQVLEDIETINIELELGDIKGKPTIYVLNVDEDNVANMQYIAEVEKKYKQKAILISARMEEELIEFDQKEREDYLKEVGVEKSGLERLILHTYSLLDLITFYTIKPSSTKVTEGRGVGRIVSAWSLRRGSNVIDAAEKVHTDFAQNFIKAEVVLVNQLLGISDQLRKREEVWNIAKEKGLIRLEGKDYIVQDKDVIEFKVGA